MLTYPDFKEKTIVIIFSSKGHKFSFKNDNLMVHDYDDYLILQTTCYKILALWIVGNCTYTSGVLERSKKFGFPILILNYSFRCIGVWNAPTEGNFLLRKRQYDYDQLDIAKHLIHNKLNNQVLLLKSIRKKDADQKNAIISIGTMIDAITEVNNLAQLMGIEGNAAKLYFKNWFDTLKWNGRKPRTKHDPLNVVLDIGYTQLFYLIENMLHLYGFDIYQGVLHRNFYQRKSLVCDLQEPFRCVIDKVIKKAYNLSQFHESDFELISGQYRLNKDRSKEYTSWLLKGILEYKADIFMYCQSYYRAFIRQKPMHEFPIFDIIQSSQKKINPLVISLDEETDEDEDDEDQLPF